MSTKLKLLAVLHIMFGGSGLIFGLVMFWVIANDPGNRNHDWMPQLILFFWGVYFLPAFAGGVGLLTGKAWARWLMIAVSCVVLIVIPIGTLLGAFGLWTLLGKDAAAQLKAPSALSSIPKPDNGALMAILGVGCGFVVAINLGFMIHQQGAPALIGVLFLPALIGLAISLVLGVRWIIRRRKSPPAFRAADVRVGGSPWGGTRAASLAGTCAHLEPIEQAMREAGIPLKRWAGPHTEAQCTVDAPALARQFRLPPSVAYAETPALDRSPNDPPHAAIHCSQCMSSIIVRPAGSGWPPFPKP